MKNFFRTISFALIVFSYQSLVHAINPTYSVGGIVSNGLQTGTLVLSNNSSTLTVNVTPTSRSFVFPVTLASGSTYNVTVTTPPNGYSCTVNNGTGSVGVSPINTVMIVCNPSGQLTVSGTVSGLLNTAFPSSSVLLQNNARDIIPLATNGSFTIPTPVAQGGAYDVTVAQNPVGQKCRITNTPGVMGSSNVTNLSVTCSPIQQHAYFGLGQSVVPMTLVPGRIGTLGTPINGFGLSEPAGIAANPRFLYVADTASSSIKVFSVPSNAPVGVIPVASIPTALALSPSNAQLYAVSYQNGQTNGLMTIINTLTNTVVGSVPVGRGPSSIAVLPNSSMAYVANSHDQTVTVVNLATNTVAATVTLTSSPTAIVASPDGSKVYVSSQLANRVYVINSSNNTIAATVSVGNGPKGMAVTPDGSKLYVALSGDGTISSINTLTKAISSTFAVEPGLVALSLSFDGTQLYATSDQTTAVAYIVRSSQQVTLLNVGDFQRTMGQFIA